MSMVLSKINTEKRFFHDIPDQTDDLLIEAGKDYCTLVTCTPYGINTHRLLVRGHRIPTTGRQYNLIAEAVVIDPMMVAIAPAIPLLVILFMAVMLKKPEKKPDSDVIETEEDME